MCLRKNGNATRARAAEIADVAPVLITRCVHVAYDENSTECGCREKARGGELRVHVLQATSRDELLSSYNNLLRVCTTQSRFGHLTSVVDALIRSMLVIALRSSVLRT